MMVRLVALDLQRRIFAAVKNIACPTAWEMVKVPDDLASVELTARLLTDEEVADVPLTPERQRAVTGLMNGALWGIAELASGSIEPSGKNS